MLSLFCLIQDEETENLSPDESNALICWKIVKAMFRVRMR